MADINDLAYEIKQIKRMVTETHRDAEKIDYNTDDEIKLIKTKVENIERTVQEIARKLP